LPRIGGHKLPINFHSPLWRSETHCNIAIPISSAIISVQISVEIQLGIP